MPKKKKQENTPLYLKNVKLSGYKTIRKVEIDLDKGLNIIIGKNGTGKTNFLEFLDKSLRFDLKGQFLINVEIDLTDEKDDFKIQIKNNSALGLDIGANLIVPAVINDLVCLYYKNGIGIIQYYPNRRKVYSEEKVETINFSTIFFHYGLPKNTVLLDFPLFYKLSLRESNSNLSELPPSNLLFLQSFFVEFQIQEDTLLFKTLLEKDKVKDYIDIFSNNIKTLISQIFDSNQNTLKKALEKFSPIKDIRINPNYFFNGNPEIGEISINNVFIEFLIDNIWQPFLHLSDGTKRIFCAISEIVYLNTSKIILLEEPELGIHPHQLDLLMEFLKEYSKECQIILTTHSPQVLDILGKDELHKIIIAEMTEDGTKLRHLTAEETKKAQNYMENEALLSDYWRFSDLER
jgi:predicted ATP-dependent endonuclease of OLD family